MFFNNRRDPMTVLWGDLNRLQHEMTRLFSGETARSSGTTSSGITLWDDDTNVYAETDLPGVSAEKLDVTVKEGNLLSVQAERDAPANPDAAWHRQERPFGKLNRVVTLPVLVDADRVEAVLKNGVLRLTLPKSAAAQPQKISVKSE